MYLFTRHSLTDSWMLFDLPQLEASLAGAIYAGKLHFAPVTESTNTDALAAARAGAPHGSVYFADEQLAGRGRGDHAWHSVSGEGLYVSVLLRPDLPAARLPLLPLAAGLAAANAIAATTSLTVDLRWPNDLLIASRKVGGILVESRTSSEGLPHAVVVGIGINVHQRAFAVDLATPATSLDLESGVPSDAQGAPTSSLGWQSGTSNPRQPLLVALLKSLQREALGLLDPTSIESIPRRVQAASTWVRGRSVHVHGPQACTGVTAGLDENGFLLVETETGLVTVQTGGLRAANEG
ncbi:MAG: biotin--[acetyl-CoA-carboxylase] ligase [Terracidiphilus sp.]|nr:biotin--[acetyl-CoA-carboxylase] ligase [Terracidiphilus sp.]